MAPRRAQPDEEKHNLEQHEATTIIKNPNFMGEGAAEVSKKRRASVAPGKKKSKEDEKDQAETKMLFDHCYDSHTPGGEARRPGERRRTTDRRKLA